MSENAPTLQAATFDRSQHPLHLIASMERNADRLQAHTVNLLALTWPWNAASKETHRSRWEQARQQVAELWSDFRPLHAGFESLTPRQQHLLHTLKPLVQTLVMRAGFAFQLLEEAPGLPPASSYSALIREFHDSAIWLRELVGAFGERPVSDKPSSRHFGDSPQVPVNDPTGSGFLVL